MARVPVTDLTGGTLMSTFRRHTLTLLLPRHLNFSGDVKGFSDERETENLGESVFTKVRLLS